MFGVQWDLVLKHIEVKEVAKGTALATIQSALRSDSSSWGNNSGLILTGSNETYKKINIYDLAGNVFEWTLEFTGVVNSRRTIFSLCYKRKQHLTDILVVVVGTK